MGRVVVGGEHACAFGFVDQSSRSLFFSNTKNAPCLSRWSSSCCVRGQKGECVASVCAYVDGPAAARQPAAAAGWHGRLGFTCPPPARAAGRTTRPPRPTHFNPLTPALKTHATLAATSLPKMSGALNHGDRAVLGLPTSGGGGAPAPLLRWLLLRWDSVFMGEASPARSNGVDK